MNRSHLAIVRWMLLAATGVAAVGCSDASEMSGAGATADDATASDSAVRGADSNSSGGFAASNTAVEIQGASDNSAQVVDVVVAGKQNTLFAGGSLLLAGRIAKSGAATLVLKGTVPGLGPKTLQYPLNLQPKGQLAARAWAEIAIALLIDAHDNKLEPLTLALSQHFRVASEIASYLAPALQAASAPPGCAFGQPGDAVVWSEPAPVGDVTVVDVVSAPNGCHLLQLLSKTGIVPWTLCLPVGALPFEAGDDFYASPLKGGHNLGPIVGLDLLGNAGKRVRFGRGQDIVYFGKGTGKVEGQPSCGVGHDSCGSALLPVGVQVTLDGKATSLSAG